MNLASSAVRPRPQIVPKAEPEIGWTPADRIEPGEYPAYSRSAKVYRDPQFNRWVCAIQFDVMDAALLKMLARLTWFLNLGEADQPHAGRRSAYWDAWLAANGKPPARRDRLSSVVFTKRQARVLVADTELMVETRQERRDTKLITKTATKPAPDAARYSVIRKVLSWETGGTE